jgi:hypothetical protein
MDYDMNDKISRMYHVSTPVIFPLNAPAGILMDYAVQAPAPGVNILPGADINMNINSYLVNTGQVSNVSSLSGAYWRPGSPRRGPGI